MYCSLCGTEVEDIEDAIEQGWLPSFWDGEIQREVACAKCADTLLQYKDDGEYEVKPEYRGKLIYANSGSKPHILVGIAIR